MTRPTDADVDCLSRVYCASWRGATFKWEGPDVGYIVQVKPKGFKAEPLPDFAKAKDEELVKVLESASNRRRMEAQRELVRHSWLLLERQTYDEARFKQVWAKLVQAATQGDGALTAKASMVYTLNRLTAFSEKKIVDDLMQRSDLHEHVFRAAFEYNKFSDNAGKPSGPVLSGPVLEHLALNSNAALSKSPRVRLQLTALLDKGFGIKRYAGQPQPWFQALLTDEDTLIRHVAVNRMRVGSLKLDEGWNRLMAYGGLFGVGSIRGGGNLPYVEQLFGLVDLSVNKQAS